MTAKKESFLKDSDEVTKDPDETGAFQEWVCQTASYGYVDPSEDPSMRDRLTKMFRPGDTIFSALRPSKHFVTMAAFKAGGSAERVELLKELRLVGVIITDSLRKQTPRALSEYLSAATKAKRLEANRRKTEAEAGRFHE